MGAKNSVIKSDQLEEYETLTYLTKHEILNAWKKWTNVVNDADCKDVTKRYDVDFVENINELKCNPFRRRLTHVFSSENDARLSFEDFLDMLSVMSARAPAHLKAHYAFHMYDFNEDGLLTAPDLKEIVNLLTEDEDPTLAGEQIEEDVPDGLVRKYLSDQEKEKIVEKVLTETDLNNDGITVEEFKHLVFKCPDFVSSFKFSI